MRLLITGGGTGGHVYPALAVLEALRAQQPDLTDGDVAWVGSSGGAEEGLARREGLPFLAIDAGPLLGAGPARKARNLLRLARGYLQARQVLARFGPEVVLSTGGYVSVPLVLAARHAGVPVLVYLPDMTPGYAVRLQTRWATRIAVSFEAAGAKLARPAVVTGYPVRRAVFTTSRAEARRRLGLAEDTPVLLAFGGSTGARSINLAVRDVLRELLMLAQVVHVTGGIDYDELRRAHSDLPAELRRRYHLTSYLHQMTDALVAADLAVTRAGAATLGEFPAARLPAVLVPYPYSAQHQRPNAEYLASQAAAVIVDDGELASRLLPMVRQLLGDPARLEAMRQAAAKLAVPDAAERIAAELIALAGA